jgi:putative hemolysin
MTLIEAVKVARRAAPKYVTGPVPGQHRVISTEDKMKIQWIIAALFLTAAYMTIPVFADAGAGSTDQGPVIGMPDPSAVWAEQMGYPYETRTDDQGGQYGVIILPDGTERDAWEAYREYLAQQDDSEQQTGQMIGMPNPSAVWADEMGYPYETRTDDQGGQYGVIILSDGTERDAWEAYREYLAQQDDEAGPVNPGGPMIGVPGQTGYLDLIKSDGYRHDLFTYKDGTGRDSLSAFRENGALSRVHTGTAAASLLGGGQTSWQSLIASLLEQ